MGVDRQVGAFAFSAEKNSYWDCWKGLKLEPWLHFCQEAAGFAKPKVHGSGILADPQVFQVFKTSRLGLPTFPEGSITKAAPRSPSR